MSLIIPNTTSNYINNSSGFDIFLNHSGQQKLFVQYLYLDLQRANYTKVFFDQDARESLPKGSPLLTTILDAIHLCKLGVVVISHGFITSLWPMMELQHLMATPDCTIYPIFYELQPGDLVNSQNLKKWHKCWEDMTKKKHSQGYPININSWPKLLEGLKLKAGTTIPSVTSHYEKLSEIVSHICNILPPPCFYADPFVKGKETIVQAIQDRYHRILQKNKDVGLIALGIAGIGGSGKTTLCETMVDYYNQSEFPGRSILLEFSTHKVDQEQIISRLKIVLQKITTAHKSMIESITNLNQAISLFNHVKKVRGYFLAIDNVCEWSEEYVERILEILIASNTNDGTTNKPKVIVTSRSETLLKKMGVVDVINVPKLKEDEALDIMLSHGRCWELYKSKQISYEIDVTTILNMCYMSNAFHPLLLKTLGNIMSHKIHKDGYGWEECIDALKSTCLGLTQRQGETTPFIKGRIEKIVFNSLEVNYKLLEENLKNVFIDIAILLQHYSNLQNILMLKDYQDIGHVQSQVTWLEYYGLLKVSKDPNNQIKSIQVHDLYTILAQKEAKANGRFLLFLDGEISIVPSSLSEVTRIMNYHSDMHQRKSINVTNLKGLDFSKLLLDRVELLDLHADDIQILYEAWRHATTPITSFSFQCFLSNVNANVKGLFRRTFEWRNDLYLNSLCILDLECGYSITRLDALKFALNLQSLTLTKCYALKDIKGVEKMKRLQELKLYGGNEFERGYKGMINLSLDIADLSGCLELRTLTLERFKKIKSLADLHCPSSLERLRLCGNSNLVDVGDITRFGDNLIDIVIWECGSIKEIPYVTMSKLQKFEVRWCKELEVIMHGGVLCDQSFPSLEDLHFYSCPRLKILPRIAKTSGLKSLSAKTGMNCVFNVFESKLGLDITRLDIEVSRERFMFLLNYSQPIAVSGSTNLEELRIKVLTTYKARICKHGVENCSSYTNLSIQSTLSTTWECSIIPRPSLSFLSELHGLRELQLEGFDFIKSLEELSCLTNLECLELKGFAILERLPNLSCLKNLSLECCSSLEDLPALRNLPSLILRDCRSLRRLPHNWSAPSLEILYISRCPALENFQDSLNSCSCLTEICFLKLDYDSYCCSTATNIEAPDLSNLTSIGDLTLKRFPASSLSNFKWPKRMEGCVTFSKSNILQYGSQLDLSNLTVKDLRISGCTPSISCWINLCKWPQTLRHLELENVFDIDELYPCLNCDISGLSELKHLEFSRCNTVRSLEDVICPTSLENVSILFCESLEKTPNLSCLVNLREIRLSYCPYLEQLPDLSNGCTLNIENCPRLKTCY